MPNLQEIGFIFFRILVPLLLLLMQYMLLKRVHRWLKEQHPSVRWARILTAGLFGLFNISFIIVAITRPRLGNFSQAFICFAAYPFFIWFGATFFIGLLIVIGSVFKIPWKTGLWLSRRFPPIRRRVDEITRAGEFQSFDTSRRVFLRRGLYGLTAVSFAGSSYGVLYGRSNYEVTRTEFIIPDLPPELHDFTIGLMSDIHSSAFMTKDEMDRYVAVMNAQETDLIAVTGDFVNSLVEEVYPFAESFSALRAPHGVYGVLGNHDFFTRNVELVAREIDDCGVKLLRNDKITVERNGGKMTLLGVDDVGRGQLAAEKISLALGRQATSGPRILLCHRPYFLEQAAEHQIDLVLSGHTHGGQVSLGRFSNVVLAPASFASKYVWGKYRTKDTHMYVSRGIGTVGLPIRINCPPEITVITLLSGPKA